MYEALTCYASSAWALLVGLVDPVRAVAPESVAPVQIQALFRLYSGSIQAQLKLCSGS